jgi:hypothetical protein
MACRTFQLERLALRQLVGSLPVVTAPPDFDFHLRARLNTVKSAGHGSFYRARFAPGLKAISVAAAFVLLLTAAVVLKQFQPGAQVNAPLTSENNRATARGNDEQPRKLDGEPQPATAATRDEGALAKSNSIIPKVDEPFHARSNIDSPVQFRSARTTMQPRATRSTVGSNDYTFGGTPPVITPVHTPATNSTVEKESAALLQVSSQPVRLFLHDKQGAMRAVFLGPVIFGSQDILERTAQRSPAASEVEGIW